MSRPDLDPELAAALQLLAELGPLEVLDVHPTPPGRRPAPPAPAELEPQPSLFDPEPAPAPPATTDPLAHIPPHRRWRAVLRHPRPLSPATPTSRRSL